MIFCEITEQDIKLGSHVKNTKTGVHHFVTYVETTSREIVIDDKFIITSYGITQWQFGLIVKHKHTKSIKNYMCGNTFHAKLIKPK